MLITHHRLDQPVDADNVLVQRHQGVGAKRAQRPAGQDRVAGHALERFGQPGQQLPVILGRHGEQLPGDAVGRQVGANRQQFRRARGGREPLQRQRPDRGHGALLPRGGKQLQLAVAHRLR